MKLLKPLLIGGILVVIVSGFFVLSRGPSSPVLKSRQYYTQGTISIESIDHQTRDAIEDKPFSRFEGDAFGLTEYGNFSALASIDPFWYGHGIASGDFNNDGWQDIILATDKGVLLYKNLGTYKFALEDINIPEINNLIIHVATFVDINNDGWQDIYITSYEGKNYFILNNNGYFQNPILLEVPNAGALLTESASFGDIDKDGDLDFVHGNWFFGGERRRTSKSATNKLILNEGLQFQEKHLEEIVGVTLSILFSDFTNDGTLDLIVGNDFSEPDVFYEGVSGGKFAEISRADNVIQISATDTMSIDVADFNNDLYMDIYVAGTTGPEFLGGDLASSYCFEIKSSEEKQKCENYRKIDKIISERNIERCAELGNPKDKNDCAVIIMTRLAARNREEGLCNKIPASYKTQLARCHRYFDSEISKVRDSQDDIPQKGSGNVLLEGSKEGVFKDVSHQTNSSDGGWSWNAKFADLDNDEWQDIYVVNGAWGEYPPYSNVFLHNYQGQYFQPEQEEFNLKNFNMVVAYTYIDIDNDGDLDIISAGLNGPINVYVNNQTTNNSITFEFRDNKGNHFGIGNKIYIYYGENSERHQVREIKSGGGFLSFDSPILHFGLGKYDIVNRIEIVWSTGEKTTIDKEFVANKKYVISREK